MTTHSAEKWVSQVTPQGDPMALHAETREALLALIKTPSIAGKTMHNSELFFEKSFDPNTPNRINQGNKMIAHHTTSNMNCLEQLRDTILQTEEQRAQCAGYKNMVPIYQHRKSGKSKFCIDIFEFPNQACELPMVWVSPTQAAIVCEVQGKRLCTQEEWVIACRGDPEGKHDSLYAYGDELDLTLCNTNKSAADFAPPLCKADSAATAWRTCGTNTEPAGAFPKCRSRFGVFDMHGNAAEIMTRQEASDGRIYSQLKGSAFFYVDVARKPNEPSTQYSGRETYPDHCAYDPRWHVEPIDQAWHVNYHLGFRCCKTIGRLSTLATQLTKVFIGITLFPKPNQILQLRA